MAHLANVFFFETIQPIPESCQFYLRMSVGSIVSYCIMNYQSCSFMKNPAGFRLALENGVMDRFLVEIGSLD